MIFHDMNGRGCQPNVATYNLLIMYMCKIRKMEVYELVDVMDELLA